MSLPSFQLRLGSFLGLLSFVVPAPFIAAGAPPPDRNKALNDRLRKAISDANRGQREAAYGMGGLGEPNRCPPVPEAAPAGTLGPRIKEIESRLYSGDFQVGGLLLHRHEAEAGGLDDRPETQDTALWTGTNLASLCMKYGSVTDPEEKQKTLAVIRERFQGIKTLFEVTGIPGYPARFAFNPQDPAYKGTFLPERSVPCVDKPREGSWREAQIPPAADKYRGWRFQGDTSRDQYNGLIYGMGMCAIGLDDPALKSDISKQLLEVQCALKKNDYSPPRNQEVVSTCYKNKPALAARVREILFAQGLGNVRQVRVGVDGGPNVSHGLGGGAAVRVDSNGTAGLMYENSRTINGSSKRPPIVQTEGSINSRGQVEARVEGTIYDERGQAKVEADKKGIAVGYERNVGRVYAGGSVFAGNGDAGASFTIRSAGGSKRRPLGSGLSLTPADLETRDRLTRLVEHFGLSQFEIDTVRKQLAQSPPETVAALSQALGSILEEVSELNLDDLGQNNVKGMMRFALNQSALTAALDMSAEAIAEAPSCRETLEKKGLAGFRDELKKERNVARTDMIKNPERFSNLSNVTEYYGWHFRFLSTHLATKGLEREGTPEATDLRKFVSGYFGEYYWRHTYDHQNPMFTYIAKSVLGDEGMEKVPAQLGSPPPNRRLILAEASNALAQASARERRNIPGTLTAEQVRQLGTYEPADVMRNSVGELSRKIGFLAPPAWQGKLNPHLVRNPLPVKMRGESDFLWQRNPREPATTNTGNDPNPKYYPRGVADGRTEYNGNDAVYAYWLGRNEGAIKPSE